jgi:hypothetical protein
MKQLRRWLIFLIVGFPVQLIVYMVYPVIWVIWRLFFYVDYSLKDKIVAEHEYCSMEVVQNDLYLIENVDDHGAFTMYGSILGRGLKNLTLSGDFIRRRTTSGYINLSEVSGDVVIAWCFAYTFLEAFSRGYIESTLFQVAKNYLKNLGTTSIDEINDQDVSNRCNNFGINYCPDSNFLRLGQPMAGPQFYTSSCLFALASQTSALWKLVFWTHWWLLGGWYWCWWPVVYTKKNQMESTKDMTMKALYVLKFVFGNRWWIKKPMEFITYNTTEYRNDLWYAMLGLDPLNPIPKSMDSFFSQMPDATSRISDRMNPNGGLAIYNLAVQASSLNYKT